MKKEGHPYRIYSNVSKREYALLKDICRRVGFRSIYQLMQTLVRCLLRYADTAAYRKEDKSLGVEVEEMFDSFLDGPTYTKSYTTEHHSRIDY